MADQPRFWLQVRNEYILDNFDNLLNYLRQYNYLQPAGINTDYNDTLQCMTELSEHYVAQLHEQPFYENPVFDHDNELILKLLCATILASRKAGITPWRIIAATVELTIRMDINIGSEETDRLFGVVLNCIRCRKLTSPGIGWNDISAERLNMDILGFKLSQMSFAESPDEPYYCLEQKGTLIVPPRGESILTATNLNKFRMLDEVKITEIPDIMTVVAEKSDIDKHTDFDKMFKLGSEMANRQLKVKASPAMKQLSYGDNDTFAVQVVTKRGTCIVAETIDPKYEKIKGNVLIKTCDSARPAPQALIEMVTVGDIMYVNLTDEGNCRFEITDTFEDFYRDFAADYAGQPTSALVLRRIGPSIDIISSEGIRGMVHASKLVNLTDEEIDFIDNALVNQTPIPIKFYKEAQDLDAEKFRVYAEIDRSRIYSFVRLDKDKMFTRRMAENYLFNEFLARSAEEASSIRNAGENALYMQADPVIADSLVSILNFNIQFGAPSTFEKLSYLNALMMLCRLLGRENEYQYVEHERHYLRCLVDFARNKEIRPLETNEALEEIPSVKEREEIIGTLSHYTKKIPGDKIRTASLSEDETESTSHKIRALVEASNSLIDIIDETELNTIKQTITKALDVEDEYVSILDERTFYGIESISLEFKTSAVFPPANRRRAVTLVSDPETQKWNIIKAVCGFMNTRYGGELLIGVRDNGYAQGIDPDIVELAKLNLIPSADTDHYRTYIQNLLDQAFRAEGDRSFDMGIPRSCVAIEIEENAEGTTILRLKVSPYRKSIVELATPASERPEWTESSYVRLSGRTVPIDNTLAGAVRAYKG